MNKAAWMSVSAVVLLGLGAGVYYFTSNVKASTTVHPDDQWMVDQSVQNTVQQAKALLDYHPVENGRIFPKLNWPVLKGPKNINWNKPTLVTFGSEFAPTVKDFDSKIRDLPIQRLHVIYNQDVGSSADIITKQLQSFNDNVTVMDAKTGPYKKYAKIMKQFGLFEAGYAFLLDKDRKVIFQNNAIGLSTDNLRAALQQFLAGKPITVEDEVALVPNQTLPTDFLPDNIQQSLKTEWSKKTTIILFSSPYCFTCKPWLESLSPYIEKWKSKEYGVVFIESDQTSYKANVDKGFLNLSDKSTDIPERSEILKKWNVRGFPEVYIIENGKYKGSVPFTDIKTDNGHYFDIQMKAIDVVLKNRSHAQKS